MNTSVYLIFNGKAEALAEADSPPRVDFVYSNNQLPFDPVLFLKKSSLFRTDNLECLKFLNNYSTIKFDFIYIDPPYNLGKDFTFADKQTFSKDETCSESAWLCMMTPRLKLAQRLLNEEGIMFISIDDKEIAPLTLLLKEIFGSENHVGTIKWKKKRKPSFLKKNFSPTMEYILIFAKNIAKLPPLEDKNFFESTRPVLNKFNKSVMRELKKGTKALCQDKIFSPGVYRNLSLSFELLDTAVIKNNLLQNTVRVKGPFRVQQEVLDASVYITKRFGLRRQVVQSEMVKRTPIDFYENWPTNEDSEKETHKVFGEVSFIYPKPVEMLKNLLGFYPFKKNKSYLAMDFFAGSGSFAHAVAEFSHENELDIKFCCVQSEEKVKKKNSFHVIADITQARIHYLEKTLNLIPPTNIYIEK